MQTEMDGDSCCRSAKDAIVGDKHLTSDGQEHKIIWPAGPERNTIFQLRVTACGEQGSHCRDK